MSVADNPLAHVGARVLIVTHRATVRYVGEVAGQTGVWVGVEYDDPSRGKHDGVTGGVRYFTTTSGQTSGSFVRIEKVNFGTSVLHALQARYSNQRGELGDVTEEQMYVRTATNRRVNIQVVGVEQIRSLQSQTDRLLSARLVGAGISHVGDSAALTAAAANLTELDLTDNLLSSWEGFVPELGAALPSLQVLNLSDNHISWPTDPASLPPLPNIRALVLNDCGVTWAQVLQLQPQLPNLQELHLSGNGIAALTDSQGAPGAWSGPLEVVSLDDNSLTDWSQVVTALGALPSLRVLNLSQNPLASLQNTTTTTATTTAAAEAAQGSPTTAATPSTSASTSGTAQPTAQSAAPGHPLFLALKTLYLASCQLASWRDVDVLNTLPALSDLRLTGNPVLATAKGGGRYEVVGRVAHLTLLNGAAVGNRERHDSELRYLQTINTNVDPAQLACDHPRYPELLARYGDVSKSSTTTDTSLAASVMTVKLTCVSAAASAKMGTQEKKIPRGTQLQALQLLCEKLFKVKVSGQRLFVKTPGDPVPERLELEDGTVTLSGLGVQDGYEILVDQEE